MEISELKQVHMHGSKMNVIFVVGRVGALSVFLDNFITA